MQICAQIAVNLAAAWAAGGVIGIERSWYGRAAGFAPTASWRSPPTACARSRGLVEYRLDRISK